MLSRIGWNRDDAKTTEIDSHGNIWSVAFLDDGEHIVSSGQKGKIRRWRVQDGAEVGTPMDAGSIIGGLVVSGDRKWIVSGTGFRRVTVWDAERYSKAKEISGHDSYVYALDVSPDATRVATGSNDGSFCVWSLPNLQRLLGPFPLAKHVVAVKFSPDGRLIALATWGPHSVQIRDGQDGHSLVEMPLHVGSTFNQSLAWASDSKRVFALSSDGDINCIGASTGVTVSKWRIHGTNNVRCISLICNSPIVAASAGSSVSFWDITTHKRVGSTVRHPFDIVCMAISKNYNIAVGGDMKITLQNLCDVLPSSYYESMSREQETQRLIQCLRTEKAELEGALRAQKQSADDKIARLEMTIQGLHQGLASLQRATNQQVKHLKKTIKSHVEKDENSKRKIAALEKTVEELYAQLANSRLQN